MARQASPDQVKETVDVYCLVSYEEFPRDEVKFPGNTTEYYPDYIVGWLLITNPGTSARIVEVRLCFMFHLSTRISDLSSGGSDRAISLH